MSLDIRNQLIVLIVGACLFMPFLGRVHLFDWDEINFAEAGREMIVSGNYLQVHINYEPFWEKPPLFFWLQALSMRVFGINEFGARFVNALCGVLTLLIVYRIGRKLFDRTMGLLWALAFLGSFLPHLFFKSGIIDPVFNLFIFLGIYFFGAALGKVESKQRSPGFLWSGVCIGLATLTKGPVAFLVMALCAISYSICLRRKVRITVKEIAVFFGALCLVSGLWYGLETLLHGPWFITEFIKYQIRLFKTGDAGHGRPFYFHFVILLFGCFPASFLAIRSFFMPLKGPGEQSDFTRWMKTLFWVVLILFSIVKTKTVLYSSLCYFPITYLAALHMHAVIKRSIGWNKAHTFSLAAFGGFVALIIAAFPIVMMHKEIITPLIADKFAVACLQRPIHWSYHESLIGIGYAAVLALSVGLLLRKKYASGFASLFLSSALCLQLFMIDMVPKMEKIAGGGPIEFYQCLKGKNCYACSLFRTYADLFYFGKMPGINPRDHDREWLLSGPIDKPAFFVCRIDKAPEYRGKYDLHELKDEYGFVYFRRDAVLK